MLKSDYSSIAADTYGYMNIQAWDVTNGIPLAQGSISPSGEYALQLNIKQPTTVLICTDFGSNAAIASRSLRYGNASLLMFDVMPGSTYDNTYVCCSTVLTCLPWCVLVHPLQQSDEKFSSVERYCVYVERFISDYADDVIIESLTHIAELTDYCYQYVGDFTAYLLYKTWKQRNAFVAGDSAELELAANTIIAICLDYTSAEMLCNKLNNMRLQNMSFVSDHTVFRFRQLYEMNLAS